MTEFSKNKTSLGYIEAVPRPSQEALNAFYQEQYYSAGVSATYQTQYSDDEIKQKQLRAAACTEAVCQNLPRQDASVSFLEIGSGEGFLLAQASLKGWECRGVDFQRAPVEKFNPDALSNFVEATPSEYLNSLIQRQERFSVVALQNVLEHTLDPDCLMTSVRNILKPDGLFLIQVPNDYSPLQEVATAEGLVDREYWFLPPQHLNYFNTRTLHDYVTRHGFTVADAFADFPIEFYLWGNETNYTRNKALGPLAHKARVELDLLMSNAGMKHYLNFYRALYEVGMGRNICMIVKPTKS